MSETTTSEAPDPVVSGAPALSYPARSVRMSLAKVGKRTTDKEPSAEMLRVPAAVRASSGRIST